MLRSGVKEEYRTMAISNAYKVWGCTLRVGYDWATSHTYIHKVWGCTLSWNWFLSATYILGKWVNLSIFCEPQYLHWQNGDDNGSLHGFEGSSYRMIYGKYYHWAWYTESSKNGSRDEVDHSNDDVGSHLIPGPTEGPPGWSYSLPPLPVFQPQEPSFRSSIMPGLSQPQCFPKCYCLCSEALWITPNSQVPSLSCMFHS